jgi:hypothetical protein
MDYYVLTLPETIGLWKGLQLQHMLRSASWAAYLPYLFILLGGLLLLYQEFGVRESRSPLRSWFKFGGYLAGSLLILALFWPEASPFGHGRLITPDGVASYAAEQDGAPIVTAQATGEVDPSAVLETPGFGLLLRFITDTPLRFARALNPEVSTAFRPMVSMSWLLDLQLPAEVTRWLDDWVEGCWKPALQADIEFQQATGAAELMPWGNTPVAQALASRDVIPGAQTGGRYFSTPLPAGLAFLSNPASPPRVRCDVYLSAVQQMTERMLYTTTSPAGTPLSQVFQEDLGKDVAWQARFLIYQAALAALGRPSPAPSLGGVYGGLSAVNAASGAVGGAVGAIGGARQRGSAITLGGLGLGALFGAGKAVGNQFQGVVEKLTTLVGFAMLFIAWSPWIFGFALMMLVGFFPVAVLYALVPAAPIRPLILYTLALLYAASSSLWLALVDLWARSAFAHAPQAQDAIISLFNWAPAMTWSAIVTIIGLGLVWTLGAAILFLSARGMVSTLRS